MNDWRPATRKEHAVFLAAVIAATAFDAVILIFIL